jgi:hypothetical protein
MGSLTLDPKSRAPSTAPTPSTGARQYQSATTPAGVTPSKAKAPRYVHGLSELSEGNKVELDSHMLVFLKLHFGLDAMQITFIAESIGDIKTSPIGIQGSKPAPGAMYAIADIDKHIIRPLRALGVKNEEYRWHFAKWALGIPDLNANSLVGSREGSFVDVGSSSRK